MAEFQEVMQQWARMCKSFRHQPNGCTGCPLSDEHCYRELPLSYDSDRVEYAVMKWAAEHPETVYPTWWEYVFEEFTNSILDGTNKGHNTVLEYMKHTQIDAETAQKLGIEPKEG